MANPILEETLPTPGASMGVFVSGPNIYVADAYSLMIFGILPPPAGSIGGVVTDAHNSNPIEGALVMAFADTSLIFYDTTDASGRYLFPELQTVHHTVEASRAGYITQTIYNVLVVDDQTIYINFALVPEGPPPCSYIPGDINGNGAVNGVDIVYGVNYLKGTGPHPPTDCFPSCPLTPNPFYAAGDVNGNCAFNGIDITFFVRYLKLQVPSLLYCQDCPPAGLGSEFKSILPQNEQEMESEQ
jgi:hypothetical protein